MDGANWPARSPRSPLGVPAGLPAAPRCTGVPAGVFAPHRRPPFVLYDAIGDPTAIDRAWLEDCEGEAVTIAPRDAPAFHAYLRLHLPDILATEAVPLADRAWAVHRALLLEVASMLAQGNRGRADHLVPACRALAGFLRAHFEPDALLRSLRMDAPHTPVVHAVETAIGTVAVALAHGQRAVDALALLGTAAAFADAGLLELPRALRMRHGPLTPVERAAIEHHPERSLRRMQAAGVVSPEAQRAVLYHHERWDGRGYPARLTGGTIPLEARYIAIADTYSALTVSRRGMPRLDRRDALREMASSTGQFDPGLLRILVCLLGNGMAGLPPGDTGRGAAA
ncbi:MAG: HD domain-containing phosphohydrolase [Dehalococcoidia bacterium]